MQGTRALERRRRPLFWVMFALVPLLVTLLVILAELPYASALLLPGDASSDGPSVDGTFEIGPMPVHLGDYQGPELQAFRDYKHETCGDKGGIELAICLSNGLAKLFPHGAPDIEFFSRRYHPVADLAARKLGKPCHCVTRSALIATTLLASGILDG